jgi:heptosyltransferase-2
VRNRWQDRFRPLERRLKLLVIAALKRLLRTPPTQAAPQWHVRPHRILYLRYDHIGDMVLVTGILHAIKRAQPTVTIDVLASARNASVLDGNPDVGRVYRVQKARPWTFLAALAHVRRQRYDAVLDAMVTGPSLTSVLIMWASGAKHRIGVGGRGNDFALTLPVPRVPGAMHYVDHSAALLRPFGIDPQGGPPSQANSAGGSPPGQHDAACDASETGWGRWPPRIYLQPAELSAAEAFWRIGENANTALDGLGRRRRLAVNVSAEAPWRRWPQEHYIATVRRVLQGFPDLQVLILGAPVDEECKRRIGQACAVRVDETTSARQMMALIATCDIVLTPDTAVTHVASAFRKPVVAMFAGAGGPHWGPYGTIGRVVSTPARTLASLGVEPVLHALEELLAIDLGRDDQRASGAQICGTGPAQIGGHPRAVTVEAQVPSR